MTYQTRTARVETRRPALSESALRAQLRPHGLEYERINRAGAVQLARQCTTVPEPRQLLYDITPERGRPASLATIGCAIAAAMLDPSLPDLAPEQFVFRQLAWMHGLRPQSTASVFSVWTAETQAQASADVAQALALHALETRDVVALERAIDAGAQHLATMHRLQAALCATQRAVLSPTGHRRTA